MTGRRPATGCSGPTAACYPFAGAVDLGSAPHFGGTGGSVAVGIAARPDHAGAWIAAADGTVVALGSAPDPR